MEGVGRRGAPRSRRWVRVTVACLFLAAFASPVHPPAVAGAPEPGERFFAGLRQLTFGGENAEAYFSADGSQLIFQRTESGSTCDQQYIMGIDGSRLRRVSDGEGRTTPTSVEATERRPGTTHERMDRCSVACLAKCLSYWSLQD